MARPCGATRPAVHDAGWECTGRDLIVVIRSATADKLPVVLPARALDVIEPDDWWDLPIRRFTGGDHLHLCVPRRPVKPFETDSTLTYGSTAVRYKRLGSVVGGGELFIGGPA